MTKKLTVAFVVVVLNTIFLTAVGQPNQYADFQRSISNSRANAAYIEAIEKQARTPNSAYKPVGIDKDVLNNFISIVKNNFNTSVPFRRTPEEMALIKQAQDAEIIRKAAAVQQSDARDKVTLPLYKYFVTQPITENEAGRLTTLSVRKDGSLSQYFQEYFSLPQLVRTFNEKKETASLPELLSLVLQYEILPQSALKSLQYLQTRFPQEETLIELSMLKIMPYFFEYYLRGTDNGHRLSLDDASAKSVDDIFFRLAAKYPSVAGAMMYDIDPMYSPYKRKITDLLAQKNKKEALVLIKQYLELPARDIVSVIVNASAEFYLRDVSFEEDKRLAALHNVPVLTILLAQVPQSYDLTHYMRYYTSFYQNKKRDLLITKSLKEKLDRLGEEGTDSSAVLIYAVRTALGYTKRNKEDAFELLKKSASMGNKEAQWELSIHNLNNVCNWGLKSAKEYCDAQKIERRN